MAAVPEVRPRVYGEARSVCYAHSAHSLSCVPFPVHSVVQTGYTTPTLPFSVYTTRGCATRVYPLNRLMGVV